MGSPRVVRVIGFLGCTQAAVFFLFRENMASGCPCSERYGDSNRDTHFAPKGGDAGERWLQLCSGKSPVLKTSRDFPLGEAWYFGNLPVVLAKTAVDRSLWWRESEFPLVLRWNSLHHGALLYR